MVTLQVSVAKDGGVERVRIERDPGSGFGRAARACAFGKRWLPGLDGAGKPIAATRRVNVRFLRVD